MTTPCGNSACPDISGSNFTTTYSYGDHYSVLSGGVNTPYAPAKNTNAFVTGITDPLGYQESFSYDFDTSQLTSAKDVNNQTSVLSHK